MVAANAMGEDKEELQADVREDEGELSPPIAWGATRRYRRTGKARAKPVDDKFIAFLHEAAEPDEEQMVAEALFDLANMFQPGEKEPSGLSGGKRSSPDQDGDRQSEGHEPDEEGLDDQHVEGKGQRHMHHFTNGKRARGMRSQRVMHGGRHYSANGDAPEYAGDEPEGGGHGSMRNGHSTRGRGRDASTGDIPTIPSSQKFDQQGGPAEPLDPGMAAAMAVRGMAHMLPPGMASKLGMLPNGGPMMPLPLGAMMGPGGMQAAMGPWAAALPPQLQPFLGSMFANLGKLAAGSAAAPAGMAMTGAAAAGGGAPATAQGLPPQQPAAASGTPGQKSVVGTAATRAGGSGRPPYKRCALHVYIAHMIQDKQQAASKQQQGAAAAAPAADQQAPPQAVAAPGPSPVTGEQAAAGAAQQQQAGPAAPAHHHHTQGERGADGQWGSNSDGEAAMDRGTPPGGPNPPTAAPPPPAPPPPAHHAASPRAAQQPHAQAQAQAGQAGPSGMHFGQGGGPAPVPGLPFGVPPSVMQAFAQAHAHAQAQAQAQAQAGASHQQGQGGGSQAGTPPAPGMPAGMAANPLAAAIPGLQGLQAMHAWRPPGVPAPGNPAFMALAQQMQQQVQQAGLPPEAWWRPPGVPAPGTPAFMALAQQVAQQMQQAGLPQVAPNSQQGVPPQGGAPGPAPPSFLPPGFPYAMPGMMGPSPGAMAAMAQAMAQYAQGGAAGQGMPGMPRGDVAAAVAAAAAAGGLKPDEAAARLEALVRAQQTATPAGAPHGQRQ